MNTFIDRIITVRLEFLGHLCQPTRLDLPTTQAKILREACGQPAPLNWDPPEGSQIGEFYGMPVYINNHFDGEFIVMGYKEHLF